MNRKLRLQWTQSPHNWTDLDLVKYCLIYFLPVHIALLHILSLVSLYHKKKKRNKILQRTSNTKPVR